MGYLDPFGRAAGAGIGSTLGSLIEPLDNPRQALWNIPGKLAQGDILGALPGMLGVGAGAALGATGFGLPLAMLGGSLVGGLGQGIGKSADEERFRAPTAEDVTGGAGGPVGSFLLQALGDPLTYAGMGTGGAVGRAAEKEGLGNMAGRFMTEESGAARIGGSGIHPAIKSQYNEALDTIGRQVGVPEQHLGRDWVGDLEARSMRQGIQPQSRDDYIQDAVMQMIQGDNKNSLANLAKSPDFESAYGQFVGGKARAAKFKETGRDAKEIPMSALENKSSGDTIEYSAESAQKRISKEAEYAPEAKSREDTLDEILMGRLSKNPQAGWEAVNKNLKRTGITEDEVKASLVRVGEKLREINPETEFTPPVKRTGSDGRSGSMDNRIEFFINQVRESGKEPVLGNVAKKITITTPEGWKRAMRKGELEDYLKSTNSPLLDVLLGGKNKMGPNPKPLPE